jgi:alkylhydroperoxidase family enzyme
VSEAQLRDLHRFEQSAAFSEVERLVLRLAQAMTRTPSSVPADLYASLRRHFDEGQMVELAAAIAWEQFRSRFNRVFDVDAQDFSAGAFCPLPEGQTSPR